MATDSAIPSGTELMARFGYGARGVVYLLVGGLAVLAALGHWGGTTDSQGALLVLMQRKGQAWPYVRARWPVALIGALASIGSYAIALWAMTVAPVAMVAALRETSVLFAAVLGAWLLKEHWTRQRVLGTLTIVAGVMALRLG